MKCRKTAMSQYIQRCCDLYPVWYRWLNPIKFLNYFVWITNVEAPMYMAMEQQRKAQRDYEKRQRDSATRLLGRLGK